MHATSGLSSLLPLRSRLGATDPIPDERALLLSSRPPQYFNKYHQYEVFAQTACS